MRGETRSRSVALLAALLSGVAGLPAGSGCGTAAGRDYAAAAITAAVAVTAAAVNRAATHECWAVCGKGEVCDRSSGLCVPTEPEGVLLEHEPICPRSGEGGGPSDCDPDDDPASTGAGAGGGPLGPRAARPEVDRTLADPCRGLCFRDERCMVRGREAECVPLRATGNDRQ